ncbi:MAG TPA: metalloregulator ArsR/SmtB family transcription factor [Thermomicrobiales bacterium]|nr:metalloregulator ArsR/SmtB family transcription factor [Thermomicrobiales bacterium]
MSYKQLSPQLMASIAERFRVLAEPLRLQILSELYEREQTVTELMDTLGQSHANISKHLQLLYKYRFVDRRKAGLRAYYRLANEDVFELCDIMCDRLKADATQQLEIIDGILNSTT